IGAANNCVYRARYHAGHYRSWAVYRPGIRTSDSNATVDSSQLRNVRCSHRAWPFTVAKSAKPSDPYYAIDSASTDHFGHWTSCHLGLCPIVFRARNSSTSPGVGCDAGSRAHLSTFCLVDDSISGRGNCDHRSRGYPAGPVCYQELCMNQSAIEVTNLSVTFPGRGTDPIEAVTNVSFSLTPGRALGIVGESGSGKSVTARSLLGLTGGTVTADKLKILGTDARNLTDKRWRQIRGKQVSMIQQDALSSLDPLRPIHREIADSLSGSRKYRKRQAIAALEQMDMPDPVLRAEQRSPQLSGGMRQRALIAQALIANPAVVIADEATTALDTRLTRMVLDQLAELTQQNIALAVISHDLAQIAHVADDIIVMRHGQIVEAGRAHDILSDPSHVYTQ